MLDACLVEAHYGYDVGYLHVFCCVEGGFVVHLIYVPAECSGEVEVAPAVVVSREKLEVVHLVLELAVLKITRFVSGSGRSLEVLEREPVEFCTRRALNLQIGTDVPGG